MAKNLNVIHDTDAHEWRILSKAQNGDEKVQDTVPDVVPMGEVEALQVFQGLVKEETNARRAALSLLAIIWLYAQDPAHKLTLKKYVGKGDKKTGALGTGLKEDFRQAEDLYFKQWADPAHPQHKAYAAKLPQLNERSEQLAEEDRHSYFVTRTRKAPSYANGKNLFLNYVAFVGGMPFSLTDEDGTLESLLPPEVMRAKVTEAKKDVPGPDNSWETRMQDLIRQLTNPDDPQKPLKLNEKKLPGLIQDMKTALAELQRREKLYQVSLKKAGEGVPDKASDAIEKAQKSTGRVPSEQAEKAEPVKG